MNDKFVLIRKRPAPPKDERKMLSVRDSTYNIVAGWYEALGRTTSMTDIVGWRSSLPPSMWYSWMKKAGRRKSMDNTVLELQLAELKAAFPGKVMIPLSHAARYLRVDPRTLHANHSFPMRKCKRMWYVNLVALAKWMVR